MMTGADKVVCQAATVLLLFTLTMAPAKAQLGGGGEAMMTRMAPMLETMKAKMGKRRFGMMMQTVGPVMGRMMEGGGGGIGGGGEYVTMLTSGGSEMMSMVPQLMRMGNLAIGHRRHRRR